MKKVIKSNTFTQVVLSNRPSQGAIQETMKIRNNTIWHPLNRYGNYALLVWAFSTIAMVVLELGGVFI
jgi:hypothetical protein